MTTKLEYTNQIFSRQRDCIVSPGTAKFDSFIRHIRTGWKKSDLGSIHKACFVQFLSIHIGNTAVSIPLNYALLNFPQVNHVKLPFLGKISRWPAAAEEKT
jgi:hypothetical protein